VNCSNLKEPEEGKAKGVAIGDTNKSKGNKCIRKLSLYKNVKDFR
jgi:hypothetical protein